MPWLRPLPISEQAQGAYGAFLHDLDARLRDPATERGHLTRELLSQLLHARPFAQLLADAPLAALSLDPANVTLEAEAYATTDPDKFARVKPLLWLWQNADLSPSGQNAAFGLPFRRVLAAHVFEHVGENFKCWPGVQFSVGYNMWVGDDVVVHRDVLLDDIGGIELHNGASVSDYVSVYSHGHSVLDMPDVTLRRTVIGRGARVTYHATVLAGSVVSDDAMVATGALVRGGVPPHGIAMGVPARVTRYKDRPTQARYEVDSRQGVSEPRKGNPDFPEPTPAQTRRPEELAGR